MVEKGGRKKQKSEQRLKEHIESLRTDCGIKYLAHKYRTAYQWFPRLEIEAPGITKKQALQQLRDRLAELRAKKKQYDKLRISRMTKEKESKVIPGRSTYSFSIPPQGRVAYSPYGTSQYGTGARVLFPYRDPLQHSTAPSGAEFQYLFHERAEREPRKVEGIVTASAFKSYMWMRPEFSENPRAVYVPIGTGSATNFSGAEGIQFEIDFTVEGRWYSFDKYDLVDITSILRYDLPEIPFEYACVRTDVRHRFDIPEAITDGDYGWVAIYPVIWTDFLGNDFPAEDDYMSSWLGYLAETSSPLISFGGEECFAYPIDAYDSRVEYAHFQQQGYKPRVYVGFSTLILAQDATVSLPKPNFSPQLVKYTYTEERPGQPAPER